MSGWFERHMGAAIAALLLVVCMLVLAVVAAATRHFLVGAGLALAAVALWQQIESAIARGPAESKKARGR
jgi:hypothetical protein